MALDTFDNLKLQIINWSHRDDIDQEIDDFIDLAETEMYSNTEEVLKIRGQELRDATATTSGKFLALPAGYQSMRSIRLEINNSGSNLRYRAPEQMIVHDTSGLPQFFTVTDQIEFDRVPDAAYTVIFQYMAIPTPLSTLNQTNAVLTDHPNIYLFGALWALNEFAEEDQKALKYYGRFINAIRGANKKDKQGRYGPAPAMRIEGATP